MKIHVALLLAGSLGVVLAADDKSKNVEADRFRHASNVIREMMATDDSAIPEDLLGKARCLVVIPGLKRAGFIIGGQYGKGAMLCRATPTSRWSAPSVVKMEGGSIGAQIGGGEVDVLMMVLNHAGAEKLMKSEFTLGGDVSAMAGPVGRSTQANTDALMNAKILSWSRARGLFAGITLNGSTLRESHDDNVKLYGADVTHENILHGKVKATAEAAPLNATLTKYFVASKTSRRKT